MASREENQKIEKSFKQWLSASGYQGMLSATDKSFLLMSEVFYAGFELAHVKEKPAKEDPILLPIKFQKLVSLIAEIFPKETAKLSEHIAAQEDEVSEAGEALKRSKAQHSYQRKITDLKNREILKLRKEVSTLSKRCNQLEPLRAVIRDDSACPYCGEKYTKAARHWCFMNLEKGK